MSLKGFHIFFISLSILLAAGFAVWLFVNAEGNLGMMLGSGLSLGAAAGLGYYAKRFLQKFQHISSM